MPSNVEMDQQRRNNLPMQPVAVEMNKLSGEAYKDFLEAEASILHCYSGIQKAGEPDFLEKEAGKAIKKLTAAHENLMRLARLFEHRVQRHFNPLGESLRQAAAFAYDHELLTAFETGPQSDAAVMRVLQQRAESLAKLVKSLVEHARSTHHNKRGMLIGAVAEKDGYLSLDLRYIVWRLNVLKLAWCRFNLDTAAVSSMIYSLPF